MASHNVPSAHDLELLSAYLDGELSDRERTVLEQRLAHESALQHTFDDLRATVALVRDLPRLKAPRDFRLDPAVYGHPTPWWQRLFTLGFTLQLAGAIGTVASVVLIVLTLAWGGAADQDGADTASDAEHPAAAQESVALNATDDTISLRRTATANAMTWAARTAIAFDGEGLLQTTIEAQTYYYATRDSLELTATAQAFRMTATAPPVEATQLPTVELFAGGEVSGGAVAEAADGGADVSGDLGTGSALDDAAEGIEEAEAAYNDAPSLDSAPDAAFAEGSGAVATEAPVPAIAEEDADTFEYTAEQASPGTDSVGVSGPAPADDIAAAPQAPAGVTLPPTATITPTHTPLAAQTGQNDHATATAQAAASQEAAVASSATEDDQAQREQDDDDTGMDETAIMDSASPAQATQAASAAHPNAESPSNSAVKRAVDSGEDTPSAGRLLGLGIALFVVSIVIFVLGRRKAHRA